MEIGSRTLTPIQLVKPFLGTKLLGFSIGRGSGALKGLIRAAAYVARSATGAGRRVVLRRVGPPRPPLRVAGHRSQAHILPPRQRSETTENTEDS